MIEKCEKQKMCSGVFRITFFAFHISHRGRHLRESQSFHGLFLCSINPPEAVPLSDRPGHFFLLGF